MRSYGLGTALIALALGHAADALAGPVIVRIADNSSVYDGFGFGVGLSQDGSVSFRAGYQAGGEGIFRGNGTSVQTIAVIGPDFERLYGVQPGINGSGQVAFLGAKPGVSSGIYVGSGGPTTTIADSLEYVNYNSYLSINDASQVAFRAFQLSSFVEGVFVGGGGGVTTIADTTGIFSGFNPDSLFGDPVINEAGAVAFSATLKAGGVGVYTGDGTNLVEIATTGGDGFLDISSNPSINDSGTVLFRGDRSGSSALYTGNGGSLTKLIDTSGPFGSLGNAAINNNGDFAFISILNQANFKIGIYTGSDPLADKVIETGDALDGSIVTALSFNRAFNDAGQVAFWAQLADGRTGIYRADATAAAVPEPSSLALLGLGLLAVGVRLGRRTAGQKRDVSQPAT